MKNLSFLAIALLVVACGKANTESSGGSNPLVEALKVPSASENKAKDPGVAEVDLAPLPLKISVAPGGLGAMDMTMGDRKSVTVDIGGGTSLNVSEETKDFNTVKKSYQSDKVLYPFKKWAKQEGNLAIVQFENSGKTGYVGLSYKEIGGKKYVCKTTGMDGVATVELAVEHLKACEKLSSK